MIGYQLSINAARYPDVVALRFGPRRYSYAQLNERACRAASGLAALGVTRGDRVATLVHNCNPFFDLLFGAAKLGAVFVPVNFRLAPREVGMVIAACAPRVLFAGTGFREALGQMKDRPAHVAWVDDSFPAEGEASADASYERWLHANPAVEPDVAFDAGQVQMLLHSSGTTGMPKGVIFTHATTLASSAAKIIDFDLSPRDAVVVFGPLFHAGPLLDIAVPLLLRGGAVVLGPSRQFDPSRLLATVAAERATLVQIYPTMLRRVLALPDLERYDLSSLRLVTTGGEPVPQPVLEGVRERFPHVGFINTYGSTESGPVTTLLPPADSARKMGSVGRPAFGVEVRIADDAGNALGAGAVGEVLVRSPFVCPGYWNQPAATAESLKNGWWHTGDLARRDEEGFIWITGRKKDMIKSGAENIYPVEVERVIATLPGVAEVAVVGVPDEEWGESVAAFVVLDPDAKLDAAAIVEHCRRDLAGYKKPRHVVFVDSLPRNTTNKVSKIELRARFAAPR
jgi:fatty-acyl-CoA synthase